MRKLEYHLIPGTHVENKVVFVFTTWKGSHVWLKVMDSTKTWTDTESKLGHRRRTEGVDLTTLGAQTAYPFLSHD